MPEQGGTMIVQTAFLRCRPERADELAAALSRVAAVALRDEPGTVDYMVLRGPAGEETILFSTIECFTSEQGMTDHNTSDAVAAFFEQAGPLLSDAPVVIVNSVVPPAT
jgi:quinol monooxygenase YgiN